METKLDHDEVTRDPGETALVTKEAPGGGDAEAETRAFEAAPRWVLVLRSGPEAGRRIALAPGRVSLGRSARCAIRLQDPSISRLHLWVEPRPEGVLLQEESTKNGTTLDGAPCLEGLAEAGQRIGLGQTVIEVERETPERPGRGIVEQAMQVLGAGRAPPKPPRSPEAPARRRPLLLFGAMAAALGGIALLALPLESAPQEAAVDEEREKEEAARRAFDEGIERMEAGDEEGARARFTRAARWDPGSEEPGRYLRWLDEADAMGPAGGEPLEPPPFEGAWGEEGADPRESVPAGEEEGASTDAHPEGKARPAPAPPRPRVARRTRPRVAEAREAARREARALLERAAGEEGIAAVQSLRAAWEKARALRGAAALQEEARGRLARAAFAVGEDALALGRLGRAVAHFQLALEAAPDHPAARERLASLEARAESYLVEGYALLEREPDRARAWLELVLALTEPRDPLHERAQKWLQRTRP